MNKRVFLVGLASTIFTQAFSTQVLSDGRVQFGFMTSKHIYIESAAYRSDNLTITSKDNLPVVLEVFAENSKPILLINKTPYDPQLQGTYFIQDNQLYDAITGQRVGAPSSLLKNCFIGGVIICAVGGIMYMLHKKGKLKRVSSFINKHPYATTITASIAAYLALSYSFN